MVVAVRLKPDTTLAVVCFCLAQPVDAAVTDYIGKPVVEVRLQLERRRRCSDADALEIIETRTGAPLAMVDVRESMAHLFGLGLYQDVQVDASLRGDGVVLTYNLVPAQRVRRIVFEGIARAVRKRSAPHRRRAARRVAVARARRPGGGDAPDALSRSRVSEAPRSRARRRRGRPGERVAGVHHPAGARARIGAIDVQGAPLEPVPQVLSALDAARRRRVRRRRARRAAHPVCRTTCGRRATTKRAWLSFRGSSTAIAA